MRKKLYKAVAFALTLAVSLTANMTAFAGNWQQSETGWWWQNDDGSWPANTWKWLDGNHDNIAECYYFDGNGYMLANTTTPDGYTVNENGAWTVNGVVQTQILNVSGPSNGSSGGSNGGPGGGSGSTGNTTASGSVDIKAAGYTDGISNIALEMLTASRADLEAKYGKETVVLEARGMANYQYENIPQFKLRYEMYVEDNADTYKSGAELIAAGGDTTVYARPTDVLENMNTNDVNDDILNDWASKHGHVYANGGYHHKISKHGFWYTSYYIAVQN